MARGTVRGFRPDLLRSLRRARGLTQADLALALHINTRTVQKWEGDENVPDLGALRGLAETLNVPISDLVETVDEERSLEDLRIARGLYQRDVAEQLAWARPTLRAIEAGERAANPAQRHALTALYAVTDAEYASAERTTHARRQERLAKKLRTHP